MSEQNATITSLSDPLLTPYQRWDEEIKQAELEIKDFHNRARKVVRRFLDERDLLESGNKWFNVYYANVNIMESALYAQLPKPDVTRRFKDYDDDVARVAALIIKRSITQDLDDPKDTFDSTMRHAVQDRLIPGLASAWLRLETDTAEIPYEDTTDDGSAPEAPKDYVPLKKITDQRVCVDYVFWQDFLWSPCRTWEERRWIARRVYMDRDALVKRFGKKVGDQISLNYHPDQPMQGATPGMTPKHDAVKQAIIYEIWDRKEKKVIWWSKGYKAILDTKDDPLKLVGFEPCPTPMLANITTSNTTPRPDYYMIQDQYQELDSLNNRISLLLKACKVVGAYDQAAKGIERLLNEGFENQLVPVDNWAMFAEKGGIKGSIDWLPLEVVIQAVTQLISNRELVKQQIYELTGISDIVRGATKASETFGAQELKSKFASISIKKRQDEVARFAAEILRIKAEIQIKHFDDEILISKSNIVGTGAENAALIGPALEMLHSDEGFEWRIQVTADSIAQADYAMEKADRIELLTAVSGYLEKSLPMLQAIPGAATFLVGMLKWAVAGFRNSAEIEGMLDKELDALAKAPPKEKGPSPEEQKAQLEEKKVQGQIMLAEKKGQIDIQTKQQDAQLKERLGQFEIQMKERLGQMEMQMKQMEFQFKVKELELKERELMMEMKFEEAQAARDERTALMESQLGMQAKAQEHSMDMEHQSQQHEMDMEHGQEDHKVALTQARQKAKTNGNGARK